MARNDPSTTGGLFIGRRPGTAPLRYRDRPAEAGPTRRRADSIVAGAILTLEVILLATIWGPQPAGWLWIGSHVDWLTGSVALGIVTAFLGMIATIFLTISIAMRLDRLWKLIRRAAGHEQKEGVLERLFVLSMVIGGLAFGFWFLIIQGPGPSFSPNANTPGQTALAGN